MNDAEFCESSQEGAPTAGRADADLHKRAGRGIRLLMGRQVVVQVLTLVGGILLARVLDPAQFGLYAIATFLVGAFALFGDFGLAPSFIQRQEPITERDVRVGFTLQQGITSLIVVVLFIAAPALAAMYPAAPPETPWLVRALACNLYLTSWRSMSALQLERELRYGQLARVEMIESLSYQAVAVGLAVAGFGVWSFVWAALTRGLLGAVLAFRAAPWAVRLEYDGDIVRGILRFGIPFQFQNLMNQVGGWVTPLLVGSMIGPQAVGYLTWASSNGRKPLLVVDNVMRVAFPHFSRVQHDRTEVERTLTRYLTFLLLAAGLWASVIVTAGADLVTWVYTSKWSAALPALMLYASVLALDIVGWVVGVAVNATGDTRHATRVVTTRSIGQLLLSVPLVSRFGFTGVPLAALIASAVTVPWIFRGFGQGAGRRVLGPVAWVIAPVAVSTAMGLLTHATLGGSATGGVATVFGVAGTYALIASLTAPEWLKNVCPRIRPRVAVARVRGLLARAR